MTSLLRLIQQRHSERGPFDPNRSIEESHLKMILEAARWAPTPHNMQNFEILVVDDPKRLETLKELRSDASEAFLRESYAQLSFSEGDLAKKTTGLLGSTFPAAWTNPEAWRPDSDYRSQLAFVHNWMRETPMLLIVFHDKRMRAPGSEGDVLGNVSLGCVMENMWLMCEFLGIGFQALSAFSNEQVEKQLKQAFELPEWAQIGFACRIGYASKSAKGSMRVRRDLEQICHRNRFGDRSLTLQGTRVNEETNVLSSR
jgi:nitroreductase